jgi:hypothetical protein
MMSVSENARKGFRTAKKRMFEQILKPAGFVEGDHLYVREVNGQVHGIQFQPSQHGQYYFVNVAFHYQFLPGLLACKTIPAAQYQLLDFLLWARLEQVSDSRQPPHREYAESIEQNELAIEDASRAAISALDRHSDLWKDPRWLLKIATPAEIIREAEEPGSSSIMQVLAEQWDIDIFSLAFSLASITFRNQMYDLSRSYGMVARDILRGRAEKQLVSQFFSELNAVPPNKNGSESHA